MMDSFEALWSDLRERRLLPVVAALLVAIIAVPILLSKTSDPSSPPGAAGSPAGAGLPGSIGDDADLADGSSPTGGAPAATAVRPIDVRKATTDDPFSGPSGSASSSSSPSGSLGADGTSPPPPLPSDPTGSAVPDAPFSAGSSPAASHHGTTSGSGGGDPSKFPSVPDGNGTASGNGSSDSRSTEPPPSTGKDGTSDHVYVADVKFGQLGSERTMRGIKRLRALPHSGRPVLTFVGLTSSREQAVFTVGESIEVSGGRSAQDGGDANCRPKRSNCNFLYLPVGGAVSHSQDSVLIDRRDRRYRIKVLDVRRVEVARGAGKSAVGDVSVNIEEKSVGKVRAFIHRGDQLPVIEDR